MQSHFLHRTNAPTLHVIQSGNPHGRTILFVHGFSQSYLVWMKQLQSPQLQNYRLVAVDLRGHGLSEKWTGSYDQPSMWADDLRFVIESLQIHSPLLCAWSYGTAVVGDYLHFYGDADISGVVWVSGVPGPDVIDPEWLKVRDGFLSDIFAQQHKTLQELIQRMCFRSHDEESFAYWLGQATLTPSSIRKEILSRPAIQRNLSKIQVPVRFIHGREDRLVLVESVERVKRLFPQAEISLYDEVGHAPFWEEPQRFNQEICAMLL